MKDWIQNKTNLINYTWNILKVVDLPVKVFFFFNSKNIYKVDLSKILTGQFKPSY